jgi:hypothetical protein
VHRFATRYSSCFIIVWDLTSSFFGLTGFFFFGKILNLLGLRFNKPGSLYHLELLIWSYLGEHCTLSI